MLAPRILRSRRLARPAVLYSPSAAVASVTVAASIPRPRLFSRTPSRRSQHDPHDRLRSARPLVPDALSSRLTNAGRVRHPRAFMAAAVAAAIAFYLYNSQTIPVTGRRRFNFLSDRFVAWTHQGAVREVISQVEAQGGRVLPDTDVRTMFVKKVMGRLIPVSGMADLDWEVFVIASGRMLRPNSYILFCY